MADHEAAPVFFTGMAQETTIAFLSMLLLQVLQDACDIVYVDNADGNKHEIARLVTSMRAAITLAASKRFIYGTAVEDVLRILERLPAQITPDVVCENLYLIYGVLELMHIIANAFREEKRRREAVQEMRRDRQEMQQDNAEIVPVGVPVGLENPTQLQVPAAATQFKHMRLHTDAGVLCLPVTSTHADARTVMLTIVMCAVSAAVFAYLDSTYNKEPWVCSDLFDIDRIGNDMRFFWCLGMRSFYGVKYCFEYFALAVTNPRRYLFVQPASTWDRFIGWKPVWRMPKDPYTDSFI